jgi:hypothetical protein
MGLTAYYDAASHEKKVDSPLVVAGILATDEAWTEFHRGWRATLGAFGVSTLHMVDFAHSRREFEAWKGDDQKRALFIESIINVIQRAALVTTALRLKPEDFNAVNEVYNLATEYWTGAYSLAAHMSMTLVEQWAEPRFPGVQVRHVIEAGDNGQGPLRTFIDTMLREDGDSPMRILPKHDAATGHRIHQFEACDFIAYEHRLAVERHLTGGKPFARASYRALVARVPNLFRKFDQDGLTKWCRVNPEAYPRRDGTVEPLPEDIPPEVRAIKERLKALEALRAERNSG